MSIKTNDHAIISCTWCGDGVDAIKRFSVRSGNHTAGGFPSYDAAIDYAWSIPTVQTVEVIR